MTRNKPTLVSVIAVGVLLILSSRACLAVEIIKANLGQIANDVRTLYKMEVLEQALSLTEEKYGPFKIIPSALLTRTNRAIIEVKSGKNTNVFIALTTNEWEEKTIPIRIPIRRGILDYRLLLIHKDNVENFKNIQSLSDFKPYEMGLLSGWATAEVMKDQEDLKVSNYNAYNGLFYMLATKRIDYIPRGINEIYDELEFYGKSMKNLVVAPGVALYIPAPTYIFVSPSAPRIAERLKEGVEMMVENKMLESIFNRFYSEKIAKADLGNRTIIKIENPGLPPLTPLDNKKLWWKPDLSKE